MTGGYLRKTNIIEGIGDEVIYGFVTFVAVISALVYYIFTRSQDRRQDIHPDSAANVQNAREQININRVPDSRRTVNNGQLQCPVCLAEATYAIETNCGHVFCGRCLIAYWHHGSWLGAVRCPVCRQPVTLLLENFTEQERTCPNEDRRETVSEINSYNRRFSGQPRPLMDYIRDLPVLLRHLYHEFFSVGGLILMFRMRIVVIIVLAFLYLISPLDIIPEAAFGLFGFLDDLFILLLIAIYISIIYRQFVESRARTE